jgi:chemotaxis family two-component system response regulator Rcp1
MITSKGLLNKHLDLIEILHVEDNPTDAMIMQEVLSTGKLRNRVQVVGDGTEAMQFLRKMGKYVDVISPNLILLDLKLPLKSGFEVLAEIKADKDLRHIPIIILTASNLERDIDRAYDLSANCYITKPTNYSGFRSVLQTIELFWSSTALFPINKIAKTERLLPNIKNEGQQPQDFTKDYRTQKNSIKMLMIEDNPIDAFVVESQIQDLSDFRMHTVQKLSQAMEDIKTKTIDVILLDLNLPDAFGLEGLIKLRRQVPNVPIVVLTGIVNEHLGMMALQRGAQDYLLKGVGNTRLVQAIRYAIERMRLRSKVAFKVNELEYYVDPVKNSQDLTSISGDEYAIKLKRHQILTEREFTVLKSLGKGNSNQEIAENLILSVATVKTHISNILHKLSVTDRSKAILEALRRGLI